ncbi:MAG: glycosyltransferase [Desulfobacterales bacterium]
MNICMFTNTYLPHVGGVAKSVSMFSEDLMRLGHNVLVIAPTFAGKMLENRPEEIKRVPAIQNFNGSDFSARIALPFLLSTTINEFRPDIIHSHHPYLLGDAALRTARRHDIPLIFTHHTRYEEYTHYVSMDSQQMRKFVITLSTNYANLCNRVIAPSRSIRDLLKKRGVLIPVVEIPTGVDIDFYSKGDSGRFRRHYTIPEDMPIIGHVGRLAPEKNIPFLARAVSIFLEKNDGVFLVVGGGESKKTVLDIFRKKGMAHRLIMTGVRNGLELVDAYSAMDLFVFASRSETQGMVLIEAMAAETPVVALSASGVREVMSDRENGRLLDPESSEIQFAEAMEELAECGNLKHLFKRNAARTAQHFSRNTCAEKLADLYESASEEHFRYEPDSNLFASWDKLLRAISVEWDLIAEKTTALITSFTGGNPPHTQFRERHKP